MPLLNWTAALAPNEVETLFTDRFGQWVARGLAHVTGLVPFSVAEILLISLVLWMVTSAALGVSQVIRGKRHVANALFCGILKPATVIGVLLLIFYPAWGFNYARADLITRMHWQDPAKAVAEQRGADELGKLCDELVQTANDEYERALGSRDVGHPSAPPMPMSELDHLLEHSYPKVAQRLGLDPSFAASRARAKPVILSAIMSRLLILGFYSPWTGEANYNRLIPGVRFPEVIGHEKAHQRAITSEDEANFFGFLACICSDDPYPRYSGYLMAQRQLLFELLKRDRPRAQALIAKRHPGVQRDVDAIRKFHDSHVGVVSKIGATVNNAYLKTNRVTAGVKSYELSAKLILTFAQVNGGSCRVQVPDAAETPFPRGL